jgi:hypothetical protein
VAVVEEAWKLSPHFSMPAKPVFFLGILVKAHAQLGHLGKALDLSMDALQRARALGEAMTLADHGCMALDVHVMVGDSDGVASILSSLDLGALEDLDYIRIKLSFNLILHELDRGDLDAAQALLDSLGDVDALEQPPDRAAARLCHAQLALAQGDAAAALRWIDPLAGQALYCESHAQICTVRLAAQRRLGRVDPQALSLADDALAGGKLPALLALELRRERRRAAQALGDEASAEQLRQAMAGEVDRLAASLDGRPALQQGFRQRWAEHIR